MTNNLEDEIRAVVASMENEDQRNQDNTQPPEDIQDIYVLIVREHEAEDQTQVVDSIARVATQPATATIQHDSCVSAYLFVCFSLLLILATLTFQLYCMTNPLVATLTIIPKSQTVSLTGTMQLGRVLPPLTISQS